MTKAKPAPKKKLTVAEIAKKGGAATLKKHGKEHYRAAAQKRWSKAPKKGK